MDSKDSKFEYPAPKLVTSHPLVDGHHRPIELEVTWIVPGEVYAVFRDSKEARVKAGEIHALTFDIDPGSVNSPNFPFRFSDGVYSLERGCRRMLIDLDRQQRPSSSRAETRPEVLEARRAKLERWNVALTQLSTQLMRDIEELHVWATNAVASGNLDGAFNFAKRLEQMHYRPFYHWVKTMEIRLRKGMAPEIVACCNTIRLRVSLEQTVMFPLSRHVAEIYAAGDESVEMSIENRAALREQLKLFTSQLTDYLNKEDPYIKGIFERLSLAYAHLERGNLASIKDAKHELEQALRGIDNVPIPDHLRFLHS